MKSYIPDEMDANILEIVQRDARLSAAAIAEMVGLSRPAVAERLRKMEEHEVIVGYTALINPEALGNSLTAFIRLRMPDSAASDYDALLPAMAAWPDVLEMHHVAGDDCYLLKVRTQSIARLNALVQTLNRPPYNMHTRTTIVLQTSFEKTGGLTLMPHAEDATHNDEEATPLDPAYANTRIPR